MLVGHFAVAFVGKLVEPKPSLGTLVLAAMLPDILWPIFRIALDCVRSAEVNNNV